MSFFTYILKSTSCNRIYIGQTNEIEARLKRHNSNQSLATKNKGPWVVLFKKEFHTRAEAVGFGAKIKFIPHL